MRRIGFGSTLFAVTAAMPCISFAQSTPGEINDPSTFRGSVANQALEQQAYQQQEAANQAMQQRLDANYAAYAPQGGGGGGGAVVNLKAKPLLPAANNPLLGRWQQKAPKALDLGVLEALPGCRRSLIRRSGAVATPCSARAGWRSRQRRSTGSRPTAMKRS